MAKLTLPVLVLLAFLGALFWRFTYPGDLFLSFFTDDFFYYAQVARNLAAHGVSTFNGLQLTNGYHPLWLLSLTALIRAFGEGRTFFLAVTGLIWLLTAGAWPQLRRVQRSISPDGSMNLSLALLSMTFMAVLSRTGMEVALALFFLFVFYRRMAVRPLEDQTDPGALVSGLVASCLILSRLDTALVVLVYGAAGFFVRTGDGRRAAFLRKSLPFLAGLSPVFFYALWNKGEFGTPLPISGMAKNLKPLGLPSGSTVARLLQPDLINLLFTWPALLVLLVCLVRGGDWMRGAGGRVRLCVLLHPLLFYVALSFSSDWPLWTWYLYPLVPVAAMLGPPAISRAAKSSAALHERRGAAETAVGFVTPAAPRPELLLRGVRALEIASTLTCLAVILSLARLNPDAVSVLNGARFLEGFAQTHPGRYSMGDRAGTAAWLMPAPMLQLEGLMADRPFLFRIKHRENLLEALEQLGADYYVTYTVTDEPRRGPCLNVREPYKAGPESPAMAARLCTPPVASFAEGGIDTLIFDLHDPRLRQ